MKTKVLAGALSVVLWVSLLAGVASAAVSYTGEAESKIILYKKPEASTKNQWVYLIKGAQFEVVAQTKLFYTVVTKSGKRGYVRKNDVKLVAKHTSGDTPTNVASTSSASSTIVDLDTFTSSQTASTANTASNTSAGTSDREYVNDMLALINAERTKAGLTPLTLDDTMQKAADIRVLELAKRFSNIRPDGSSFGTVFQEVGYSRSQSMAENIAYAYSTPAEAMNEWMNSEGHRNNIMNKDFRYFAVSKTISSSGNAYWVQLFG